MDSDNEKTQEIKALQQRIQKLDRGFQTQDMQIRILEKERQKFSALVNNTDAGFLTINTSFKIVWKNNIIRQWLKRENLPDTEEMACHHLMCGQKKACSDSCPLKTVFESGQTVNHEFRIGENAGNRNIYMTAIPIRSLEGSIQEALIMLQDVTDLEVLRNSQEELKNSEKSTRTLFKISNAVNTTESLDDLYRSLHQILREVIDVTNFAIGLYDGSKDIISYPYYVDETGDACDEIKDVSKSNIIAWEVISLKSPVFITKDEILSRIQRIEKNVTGSIPEQWLGVPLKIKDDVIGVIVVQSYSDPDRYEDKDSRILMSISDQVALAINRKQTEDEKKKSEKINQVLFSISNAINTTENLNDLYLSIYESLNILMPLPNFYISLYDKEKNSISFPFHFDEFDSENTYFSSVNNIDDCLLICVDVIKSRKPLFMTKKMCIERASRQKIIGPLPAVWLGVPLITKDEVIGTITVEHYSDPDYVTLKDVDLFVAVSDQIAIAIDRKSAQEELKKNEQLTRTLFKISSAVNTTESLNDLYKSIHLSLNDIIDASNFYIALYDKSKDVLTFPYNVDMTDGIILDIHNVSRSSSLTGEVIRTGKPRFFNKKEAIERARQMNLEVSGTPAELWLGVPLIIKDEVIGAIVIQSYNDPHIYDQKDMDLLIAVSDQVAIAIDRKQAQENVLKSENFTRTLFRISNAVNTTENLDELYQSIYEALNHLIKLPNFYICIVDEKNKIMRFPFYIDEYDVGIIQRVVEYEKGSGFLTLDVINSKKPVFLDQAQLEKRHSSKKASGTMSKVWIGVPLIIRDTVIGVMTVQHYSDPHYFTEEDVDLFAAVSDQVALAIDRKRSQEIILEHKENLEKMVEERTRELTSEIHERIEIEKNLKKAKIAAEAADRSKSEFLTNMSHEIRTPINGIMGMAEIALGRTVDNDLKTLLKTIDTEATSLLGIVNQILDFSKIEAGKLILESIPFNLRNTFEQSCASLALGINGKDIEFITFLSPDVPVHLMGDPGRLRQILVNLTGNAMKFTHEGEIFVKGEKIKETKSNVELRFIVKDTGIGIAKDKQSEIFESFRQADGSTTRKYGGTGLGTTISKQLVEIMGGRIGLESELEKGSIFWFTVKLAKQQDKVVKKIRAKADFKGLRILVGDDHQTSRYVFEQYLTSFGAVPVTAENEKDIMSLLKLGLQKNKPIDMVLLNLKIAKTSGFKIAKKIRKTKEFSTLPIILVTSSGSPGDGKKCKEIGIQAYLLKPIKKDELKTAISSVLNPSPGPLNENSGLVTRHTIAEEKINHLKVLLAEDYPTNQKVATWHLNQAGYHVTLAENGRIAVDLFRQHHFDLILMDIQMPEMDGYKATQMIREIEAKISNVDIKGTKGKDNTGKNAIPSRIPIIALTAHALEGYKEKCLKADMDDFITKPFRKEEFLSMIKKWTSTLKADVPDTTTGCGDLTIQPVSDSLPDQTHDKGFSKEAAPMDYEKALNEFEGDKEFLNDVIREFCDNVGTQLITLSEAISIKDFETLRKESHSIKGGAANLTALKLSATAYELEKIGKSENLNNSETVFRELKKQFHDLKEYIREKL